MSKVRRVPVGPPPRVVLAPLRKSDAPALFAWINDRALVLLSAGFHAVHETQHAAWMTAIVARPDVAIFAIRTKTSSRLIGVCQLHSISRTHRSADLQIRIGEARWRGRGYGTEALRLLIDVAFKDLNLHRVSLHVLASNRAALRSYEKAGFVIEGTLRDAAYVDGAYRDVVAMAIVHGG